MGRLRAPVGVVDDPAGLDAWRRAADPAVANDVLLGLARLAAFDGLARVIQIGSFSKTLSAAARCGYIAARADWTRDAATFQAEARKAEADTTKVTDDLADDGDESASSSEEPPKSKKRHA